MEQTSTPTNAPLLARDSSPSGTRSLLFDPILEERQTSEFGVASSRTTRERSTQGSDLFSGDPLDTAPSNPPSKWALPMDRDILYNIVYVATWSYLGVLGRVTLENICEQQPEDAERANQAVIFQVFFSDSLWNGSGFLVANILGSFIMGVMTKVQTKVAAYNPYLYVGISTGFCGCLTTFATWNQNMSQAAASSGYRTPDGLYELNGTLKRLRWFDLGFLLWIQFMLFYSSLQIGQMVGEQVSQLMDRMKKDVFRPTRAEVGRIVRRHLTTMIEVNDTRAPTMTSRTRSPTMTSRMDRRMTMSQFRTFEGATTVPEDPHEQEYEGYENSDLEHYSTYANDHVPEDLDPNVRLMSLVQQAEVAALEVIEMREQLDAAVDAEQAAEDEPDARKQIHFNLCLGCLVLGTILVWCMSWLLDDCWWRNTFRCMIFAPAGAVLRYLLSLWNKNCGYIKWFTLLANVCASVGDAFIFATWSGVGEKELHGIVWGGFIATGFNGSLSTVSTFVNECCGMKHTYELMVYAGLSIGISQVLCAIINSYALSCAPYYYDGWSPLFSGTFTC